jgi:putative spermidine/putrescine transport system permease protein
VKIPKWAGIVLNFYALSLAAFLIWPVLQLILTSFTSDIRFPPRYFSLSAFQEILWPGYLRSLLFSFKVAFAVVAILLVICLPTAYALERRRFRGRALISVLIFVPILFPMATYTSAIRVYVFMFFSQWRGNFWLVVIVSAMWAIPLVVRSIQGSLANVDPVYEEAALVMGASPWRAFVKVTLPLIGPGLLTAGMIGFTSAAMNFVVPQLLGSKEPMVSMYIFRDVGKVGLTPWIAVEVLIMEAVVLGAVQILYFVFRKQFRGVFAIG